MSRHMFEALQPAGRALDHPAPPAGRSLPWAPETHAEGNLAACLDRLRHDDFAEHVRSDQLTIAQTAEIIAASAGLALAPDSSSIPRARAHQTWVTIKHITVG